MIAIRRLLRIRSARRGPNESGQAMIEFTLVFPVILLLIMGIIEFSALSNAHQLIQYAAFNAARSAVVGGEKQFATAVSCIAISPTSVSGLSPGSIVPDFILRILNSATGIHDVGQKMVFAYFLSRATGVEIRYYDENDKKLNDSKGASYIEAVVTYYYPLKFPIISAVADLAAHTDPLPLPWPFNDSIFFQQDSDYYTLTRWAEAAALTQLTGVRFIPIVKNCYMGID